MTNNILLHENQLAESGTSVATYDYAYYIREFLNINPIIAAPITGRNISIEKFQKEFEVIEYENTVDIQKLIDDRNIENFYAIKFGLIDNLIFKNCRNLIHAVFFCHFSQYHGDVYAFVSEYMSLHKDNKIPFVPHMINLPFVDFDVRELLGIPKDFVVIGRYGSIDTFNIPFVIESIVETLEKRSNIYFIFANTPNFYNHERCVYLPAIIDLKEKVKFINTCDAMLHARDYGETFGLAVLEFASKNKQIISYDNEDLQNNHPLGGRNHFIYLKDNCHKYKNKNELKIILENIDKKNPFDTNYLNLEFSPKKVISKFKEVFL
jgi:glycosyltransferase involved in cell wall biosynthesis